MVIVDYEPLPAAVTAEDALADGAPVLFEAHGDNVAVGTTDPVNDDLFGDADVDRPRPLRQPADRGRADGAARALRRRSTTTAGCSSTDRRRCRTCCTT